MTPARLKSALVLTVLLAAAGLCFAPPAAAGKPFIDRVIVTNTTDDLIVYFNVAEALYQDQVFKAVLAGVPTTFTYDVELIEVNNFWPDREVTSFVLKRTIKYDTVTEKFTVTTHGNPPRQETTTDWIKAQELMTDVWALRVIPLKKLKKSQTYRLRIRAQIHKPQLPIGLKIFFFWVPLGDIVTDWYEVEFRR